MKYDQEGSHKRRGESALARLMSVYLGAGIGDEQTHEALNDTQDLLKVLRAMADRRKIRFGKLLALGKKKKLCGFRSHI